MEAVQEDDRDDDISFSVREPQHSPTMLQPTASVKSGSPRRTQARACNGSTSHRVPRLPDFDDDEDSDNGEDDGGGGGGDAGAELLTDIPLR